MSTYTLEIKNPSQPSSDITLQIPRKFTVLRLKELILQYHRNTPSLRSQKLIFRTEILPNEVPLNTILGTDQFQTVYLSIIQNPPEPLRSGFDSAIFKEREVEYLSKYDSAKQLLLNTKHDHNYSPEIQNQSMLNSLPICHPSLTERFKYSFPVQESQRIRLRPLPWSVFFDFETLLKGVLFILGAHLFGHRFPLKQYFLIFIMYLVTVRLRIAEHRDREMRRLSQEYLELAIPESFSQVRERRPQTGVVTKTWESIRALGLSLLPWFDPQEYAQQRARVLTNT